MWDTRPTAKPSDRPQRKRLVQIVSDDAEADVHEHRVPREQYLYFLSPAGNVVAVTLGSNRMTPTSESRYAGMLKVAITQGFMPWNWKDLSDWAHVIRRSGTAPKMVKDFRRALTVKDEAEWLSVREELLQRRRALHTKERAKDAPKFEAMAKEEVQALVKSGISEGIRAGLSVAADTAAKEVIKPRKVKGEETP